MESIVYEIMCGALLALIHFNSIDLVPQYSAAHKNFHSNIHRIKSAFLTRVYECDSQ